MIQKLQTGRKPRPNEIEAQRARIRAKDIYFDLAKKSGGKVPSDKSVRDILAREGFKYYSTRSVHEWRMKGNWGRRPGETEPLVLEYVANAEVSLEDLHSAMSKSLQLFMKMGRVLELWLNHLILHPEEMTNADGIAAFKAITPCLETITELRARITDQRMVEAKDVTPINIDPAIKAETEETIKELRERFLKRAH